MDRLRLGRSDRPCPEWPIVVAVVVRPGSCWWSWEENEVHLGLRYGSHRAHAVNGDILTVTAHGWYSQLDELGGRAPAARWSHAAAA